MSKFVKKWNSKHRINLLLALFVITASAGLVYVRYYSSYAPQPLSSSANEEPSPHWAHGQVALLDSASRGWDIHLTRAIANWESNGALNFSIVPGDESEECFIYVGYMNFCTINDPDYGVLALGTYGHIPDSGHITDALFIFNDGALFDKTSVFGNVFWRNKLLCQYMGWSSGLDYRYKDGTDSCMKYMTWQSDQTQIKRQQDPDVTDLTNMMAKYIDHTDGIIPPPKITKPENGQVFNLTSNFGELVEIRENGLLEIYRLDRKDGSEQITFIQKKSK